jgi:hypothetical protein
MSRKNIEMIVLELRLAPIIVLQESGAPSVEVTGFSTFIPTKAAACCSLPKITAPKDLPPAA